MHSLVFISELIGTAAFAISGAMIGITKKFDVFGVVVLGVITAVGGGAIRDIILNILPLKMFLDYRYVFTAFVVSIIAFLCAYITKIKKIDLSAGREKFIAVINVFDAIGLGIFTVNGSSCAIINGFGDNTFMVVFLGVLTGIGGGILRDIMCGEVPFVLRKHIYALASVTGGVAFILLYNSGFDAALCMSVSTGIIIILRILAAYFEWNLPKV